MKKNHLIFLFLWIVYLLWIFIDTYIYRPNFFHIIPLFLSCLLMSFVVFGISFYVLPSFFRPKRYWFFLFACISFYVIYLFLAFLIEGVIEPKFYAINYPISKFSDFITPSIKYFLLYSIIGAGYYFARKSMQHELELVKMEMAFLRAQINPHFIFNTLESLVFRIRKLDFETGELAAVVCQVMRYSAQQPEIDGKVSLAREINHINDLIYIFRVRFPEKCFINFTCPNPSKEIRIVPLILVTLVENALKHGEFTVENKPISLTLTINPRNIKFTTHNWKRTWNIDPGESVGMSNIIRRMELLYQGNFEFNQSENDSTYSTQLTLVYD